MKTSMEALASILISPTFLRHPKFLSNKGHVASVQTEPQALLCLYSVTRDFVRTCQTPMLVMPDDTPAHPYAVAMEIVHLAPNAERQPCPLNSQISRTFMPLTRFLCVAGTPDWGTEKPGESRGRYTRHDYSRLSSWYSFSLRHRLVRPIFKALAARA
jgi:hypothetical protein